MFDTVIALLWLCCAGMEDYIRWSSTELLFTRQVCAEFYSISNSALWGLTTFLKFFESILDLLILCFTHKFFTGRVYCIFFKNQRIYALSTHPFTHTHTHKMRRTDAKPLKFFFVWKAVLLRSFKSRVVYFSLLTSRRDSEVNEPPVVSGIDCRRHLHLIDRSVVSPDKHTTWYRR